MANKTKSIYAILSYINDLSPLFDLSRPTIHKELEEYYDSDLEDLAFFLKTAVAHLKLGNLLDIVESEVKRVPSTQTSFTHAFVITYNFLPDRPSYWVGDGWTFDIHKALVYADKEDALHQRGYEVGNIKPVLLDIYSQILE